jgi:hypothetical protein
MGAARRTISAQSWPLPVRPQRFSTGPGGCAADGWWLADERVRPVTDDERQLYLVLSGITQRPALLLAARWSGPALTVHKIEVSGPNSTCTHI